MWVFIDYTVGLTESGGIGQIGQEQSDWIKSERSNRVGMIELDRIDQTDWIDRIREIASGRIDRG